MSHFLPSKDKKKKKIDRRQASLLESFNFMLCSFIFFLSLSKPTSRESKHHLSSLEPFDFKPCSSIASHFLFCTTISKESKHHLSSLEPFDFKLYSSIASHFL
ncbi:unnamed protein product, partial [Prunus brigantina]